VCAEGGLKEAGRARGGERKESCRAGGKSKKCCTSCVFLHSRSTAMKIQARNGSVGD
jgi:hypothetical protein